MRSATIFDAGITYLRDRKYRWWDSPKYPCSDGFIMMNIPPQFWEGVIKMMDSPEWAQNPAYKTPIGLNEHMKEIQPQLIAWFKQHTCADVVKRAMAQRLDISIVQSARQLAENEMFEARKFMVEPVHPVAGKMRFPGAPCKFSATPAQPRALPLYWVNTIMKSMAGCWVTHRKNWKRCNRPARFKYTYDKEITCRSCL